MNLGPVQGSLIHKTAPFKVLNLPVKNRWNYLKHSSKERRHLYTWSASGPSQEKSEPLKLYHIFTPDEDLKWDSSGTWGCTLTSSHLALGPPHSKNSPVLSPYPTHKLFYNPLRISMLLDWAGPAGICWTLPFPLSLKALRQGPYHTTTANWIDPES
jgi:hypothetical protein